MRKRYFWGAASVLAAGLIMGGFTAGMTVSEASGATGGGASVSGGGLMTASQVHIIYVGRGALPTCSGLSFIGAWKKPATTWASIGNFCTPPDSTTADLNQETMSAIAAHPGGIALCGLDPNGQASTIAQAKAAGIVVVLTPPEGAGVLR